MNNGKALAVLGARAVLGVCFLLHGLEKFGMFGGPSIKEFGEELGALGIVVPALTAYTVAAAEILSGAALLIGCFHRIAAVIVIVIMAGAMWFVSGGSYFLPKGAEYNVALIALAASVFCQGPGPLAYHVEFKKKDEDGRR